MEVANGHRLEGLRLAAHHALSAMLIFWTVDGLSVTHFTKGNAGSNTKALHRVIGSVAFTAAPRMGFMIAEDPEDNDRKLLLHLKNNLHKPPQGLAYRLEQALIIAEEDIRGSSVVWETVLVSMTADQALAASGDDRSALDEAVDFLRDELRAGEVEVKVIDTQARKAGFAGKTLKRARAKLGVVPRRDGFGPGGKFCLALPGDHRQPTCP